MDYKYSAQKEENTARAFARSLPVSFKHTVEICSMIRGKRLEQSINKLSRVINKKEAVPFRKFRRGGVGARPGIGTGRYPVKACKYVIELLKNAQANAQSQGIGSAELTIAHIMAKQGGKQFHYGRKRRRLMKRTHLEVVVKAK